MISLKKVCMVLDFEGFQICNKFITREMGWCNWEASSYGSIHYKPPIHYRWLAVPDRRQVRYVRRNIHGLPFSPSKDVINPHPVEDLTDDLKYIYELTKTKDRNVVAYKGGQIEKKILDELKIPSVNLERFNCPKFNSMTRLKNVSSCGHHDDPAKHHCPQVECFHFAKWMGKQFN